MPALEVAVLLELLGEFLRGVALGFVLIPQRGQFGLGLLELPLEIVLLAELDLEVVELGPEVLLAGEQGAEAFDLRLELLDLRLQSLDLGLGGV